MCVALLYSSLYTISTHHGIVYLVCTRHYQITVYIFHTEINCFVLFSGCCTEGVLFGIHFQWASAAMLDWLLSINSFLWFFLIWLHCFVMFNKMKIKKNDLLWRQTVASEVALMMLNSFGKQFFNCKTAIKTLNPIYFVHYSVKIRPIQH